MIDGKHMNICYHADDCKLNHRRSKGNDLMIKCIRQEYESILEDGSGKMTVSRGKVHKYLGMTLDYTIRGQDQITMIDFLDKVFISFDKTEPKGSGTNTSEAPENLFKVDRYFENLLQSKTAQFQNLVAKTLYATKRSRTDTCTAVAFLTTIV